MQNKTQLYKAAAAVLQAVCWSPLHVVSKRGEASVQTLLEDNAVSDAQHAANWQQLVMLDFEIQSMLHGAASACVECTYPRPHMCDKQEKKHVHICRAHPISWEMQVATQSCFRQCGVCMSKIIIHNT